MFDYSRRNLTIQDLESPEKNLGKNPEKSPEKNPEKNQKEVVAETPWNIHIFFEEEVH